ncbi:MAG: DUF2207 domain-containing protein [Bifidobacteriaceae bacterium]|nr:DUF2207 domain-containing protein [Bifidobacteriaceae bacterium]
MTTLGVATAAAASDITVASLDVAGELNADGVLTLTATFSFAEPAPATLTQHFETTVDQGDGTSRLYTITQVSATAGGNGLTTTVDDGGRYTTVSIATGGTTAPVELSYTVTGTTAQDPAGIRFAWPVLQGLEMGVTEVTGQITLPPTAVVDYLCTAGAPSATVNCGLFSGGLHGTLGLSFSDGPRAVGDVVIPAALLEAGAVPVTATYGKVWSLGRAFGFGWGQIGAALAIAVLGCLALFGLANARRRRYAAAKPARIAEVVMDSQGQVDFTLLDLTVRPGVMGTLIDQSVDPSDVLATVLDLAQRGHLLITQLPRTSASALPDWSLTRLDSPDDLAEYERLLLDAIAPEGTAQTVSGLTAAVGSAIGQVQESLYQLVVNRGWFSRHPAARNPWTLLAWAALGACVAATGLLIWLTTWALLGPALIAVALTGLLIADDKPVLTTRGASMLAGLSELSRQLHTAPPKLPAARALAEGSEILPYSIVLGGWDRWIEALVAADEDDTPDPNALTWYRAPQDWHLQELPISLDSFITVVTGRLFTRN